MDDIKEKQKKLQEKLGPLPVVLIEQFANNTKTEVACVLSIQPRNLQEIKRVLVACSSSELNLKVRCSGRGYSWSPIFSDPGQVLLYTGFFDNDEEEERIQLNEPSASGELTVTALASVSDGELAKFFLKNNVCLMSGVNLPSIQLGGMVATASHGVGKDQPSVSDFISSVRIVDWQGRLLTFSDEQDAEKMKAVRCSLGLFGVMYDITFRVLPMKLVDCMCCYPTVGETLLNPKKLKELIDDKWATEIFWFPFNSMSNWETMKTAFCGHVSPNSWEPKKDQLWVKQMDLVKVPSKSTPSPEDYLLEGLGYFSEDAYIRLMANTLTRYPALTPGYLRMGMELVRINTDKKLCQTITHAIHYNTWDNLCPSRLFAFSFQLNTDEDFRVVTEAIHAVVVEVQERALKGEFPLNITMELRVMGHSDAYLNPAKGTGRNIFIELNSINKTACWEQFCIAVFQRWLKIDGACLRPNWAAEWSYLPNIYTYLRKAYGADLDLFKEAMYSSVGKTNMVFINDALNKFLFGDSEEKTEVKEAEIKKEEELEVKVLGSELRELKAERKHEESWRNFCTTVAESMFRLRGKKMKRPATLMHMMFMNGIESELAKGQAQGLFMSEALSQMLFKYDLGSKLTEDFAMAGENNRGIYSETL